jgi:hypothetical protein
LFAIGAEIDVVELIRDGLLIAPPQSRRADEFLMFVHMLVL